MACTCERDDETGAHALKSAAPTAAQTPSAPAVLYLPDAAAPLPTVHLPRRQVVSGGGKGPCPPEMVNIAGAFCIDRFEATLVDNKLGRRVSPYYHPTRNQTAVSYRTWQQERFRMGASQYQALPLPEPPAFQLTEQFDVHAEVQGGAVPNGYLNQLVAARACANAGKRLCTEAEWVRACRGEEDRDFPYGTTYQQGVCNVFSGAHPAKILHGHASLGHLDPRLNYFSHNGSPLLHATGADPECKSRWGNDAVYDMVGNLDEWIDDPSGVFVGGFYSRGTRNGCQARIASHPPAYFDYSLGVRCCL